MGRNSGRMICLVTAHGGTYSWAGNYEGRDIKVHKEQCLLLTKKIHRMPA